MKRIVIILFLSFSSLFFTYSDDNKNDTLPKPNPVFKETVFDFGNIVEGYNGTHDFEFENRGETDFIIENIKASCGCTTVDFTKTTAPGEKGYIKTTFDSSFLHGELEREIFIENNSGNTIILKIKANIAKTLTILPSMITFDDVYPDKNFTREVRIYSEENYNFKIVSLKPEDDHVSLKIEKTNDSDYKIYVTLDFEKALKYFDIDLEKTKLRMPDYIAPEKKSFNAKILVITDEEQFKDLYIRYHVSFK